MAWEFDPARGRAMVQREPMGIVARFWVVLVFASLAHADYEETEFRLKAAGVEPELRKRIHTAIDRGVKFLIANQQEDGSWRRGRVSWRRPSESNSVFATLALSHAGTPAARAGVKLGLEWLIPAGKRARRDIYRHVYLAGPMAMLLVASNTHPERVIEIGNALIRGAPRNTLWGYSTGFGSSAGGVRLHQEDLENLSTAQFGALGLWSADRVRGKPSRELWRRHLELLEQDQMVCGSWRYGRKPPFDYGGYRYFTGTFMGTANFLLAYAGSDGGKGVKRKVAEGLPAARERAIRALERDAPAYLQLFDIGAHTLKWPYYGLYALEKAAIFADREELGGVRWYVEGAQSLIAAQEKNGSWNRANVVDTAFALLFLLRSSQRYHPTTPRDSGRPTAPVSGTKKDEQPKANAPGKPPPHPVMKARLALDELMKAFQSPRASDLPKPVDVAAMAEIEPRLAGDAVLVEEWRKSWAKLSWRVLATAPRGKGAASKRWDALQVACARALLRGGRADARQLGSLIQRGPIKNRKWEPSADWWIAVVGELVPAVGDGKLALQLADDLARPNLKYLDQLVGCLRGVRKLAPKLSKKERKALVDLIVRRFEGKESEWAKRNPGDRRELAWDMIGAHVMVTLRALTRDPDTGEYWLIKAGRPTEHVGDFRRWGRK